MNLSKAKIMVSKNKQIFERAKKVIPSGVNSPVRAFKSVGGDPVFIKRAKGPYLWDEDGKRYLDFCGSWGPMLFGHAPDRLVKLLQREIEKGMSFGTATAKEVELAELVNEFFPSIEKVRLVSSGTEATMSAIRLARGFTGRKKIVKISGGYHGHVDSLLVEAGSGLATFSIPGSAGVPEELARLTITVPFNDLEAMNRAFKSQGKEIAAIIIEPLPGNMGVVLPEENYLKFLRTLTKRWGSLLIFDEVMSGFRVGPGGMQAIVGIKPDLTCLGKILGGGMPLAAFGGKKEIMNFLAPEGPVYQAGTLSGNPVAVTSALWMLKELKKTENLKKLYRRTEKFLVKLQQHILEEQYPLTINAIGPMYTLFFSESDIRNYEDAKGCDTKKYAKFFRSCLSQGLYLAPSQFEANFISTTHTAEHLEQAFKICKKALASVFK
jgi:glutamate-1-semialdehyde 2,1-aminomutase